MVTRRKKNTRSVRYKLKLLKKPFNRTTRRKLSLYFKVKKSLRFYKKSRRKLIVLKVWRAAFFKRYSLRYLRVRVDSIRLRIRLYRYSRYFKRRAWRLRYRRFYKRFYLNLITAKRNKFKKVGYYRLLYKFYSNFGVYKLLKNFIKYSRIKRILKRKRRVFRKRSKKINIKLSKSRVQNLDMLGTLFQNVISRGNQKLAANIVFKVLFLLKLRYKKDFLRKYLQSLERIRPLLYYRTMYISGKKYKIPVLMPISKSYKVSVRWLLSHSANNITISLFNNILGSIQGTGNITKFRKDYHAQSFENKTYIRFLRFLKTGF